MISDNLMLGSTRKIRCWRIVRHQFQSSSTRVRFWFVEGEKRPPVALLEALPRHDFQVVSGGTIEGHVRLPEMSQLEDVSIVEIGKTPSHLSFFR